MREEVRVEEALAHTIRAQPRGLRSEGEQQAAGDRDHAHRHRAGRRQERPQDQSDAREPEGDRHDDGTTANGV
jgi:hypothetical protein